MDDFIPYLLLADAVLVLHVTVVVFVVGGLLAVVVGNLCGIEWVNALWFRLAHLLSIAVVVAEAWMGVVCPLTTLEFWLRTKAGTPAAGGGFIEHWLQRILYYNAPAWVFVVGYTLFGLLVLAAWLYFPPRYSGRRELEVGSATKSRERCGR